MIINLLLSLVPICISTVLATLTSGGTLFGILDYISFIGVLLLFSVAIFISGYGKTFCRIFSTRKKFKALDLQELQKTDLALELGSKILFYTAVLIPILTLIYTLANYYKTPETLQHMGPNCAVLILSILYLSLFEMIIVTLKAKVRKSVILYMADETEKTASTAQKSSNIKMILGVILFLAVCILYGWISGIYAWGKGPLVSLIFDIPFMVIMIIYVLPLVAISENFGLLFRSIKTIFTGQEISVSQKNLYLNAVKTTVTLNWYGAFSGAACGWIGMLMNLEDASALPANLAVSLIPFFYATCLNLFLLLVEIRITKAVE